MAHNSSGIVAEYGLSAMQVRFARVLADTPGVSLPNAALMTGLPVAGGADQAQEWALLPGVQALVECFQAEKAQSALVTPELITSMLMQQAHTSAADCYYKDEHGQMRLKPLEQLPRNINKVSVRRNRFGEQEISVQTTSQSQAVELLGRTIGVFRDNTTLDVRLTDGDRQNKTAKLAYLKRKLETDSDAENDD